MEDVSLPAYEEYRDSLVAFVDVLGFDRDARNIQSQADFVDISALLFAFNETAAGFCQDKGLLKHFEMTTMSDSVVMSMPYDDPVCAMALIIVLHGTQYELIGTGFGRLLRGFLTRGRVYHHDNIVFGEGYSKAYEGEGQVGHAPRIVIDPLVVEDAKTKIAAHRGKDNIAHVLNYLRQDPADGLYFIDYLKAVGAQRRLPNKQLAEERQRIGGFIAQSLTDFKDDLGIRRKYEWLRWYFAESCRAP